MAYPYLPVNPCCTDVVLNTPCGCSSTITNGGCNNNDPCSTHLTASSTIVYDGPALTCTTAEPCDTLNVILQKIDEIICNLLGQINTLNNQVTNITNQIIMINGDIINIYNTLGECCGATTTTTSTTTAAPCESFSLTNTGENPVAIIITDCDTQIPEAIVLMPGDTNICVVTDSPLNIPGTVIAVPNGPCGTSTTTTTSSSSTTTTTTTAYPCECLTFYNNDIVGHEIYYTDCFGITNAPITIQSHQTIQVCGCCGFASDEFVTISIGANCVDGECPVSTTTTTTTESLCDCYNTQITITSEALAITDDGQVTVLYNDCFTNPYIDTYNRPGIYSISCVDYAVGITALGQVDGIESSIYVPITQGSPCCEGTTTTTSSTSSSTSSTTSTSSSSTTTTSTTAYVLACTAGYTGPVGFPNRTTGNGTMTLGSGLVISTTYTGPALLTGFQPPYTNCVGGQLAGNVGIGGTISLNYNGGAFTFTITYSTPQTAVKFVIAGIGYYNQLGISEYYTITTDSTNTVVNLIAGCGDFRVEAPNVVAGSMQNPINNIGGNIEVIADTPFTAITITGNNSASLAGTGWDMYVCDAENTTTTTSSSSTSTSTSTSTTTTSSSTSTTTSTSTSTSTSTTTSTTTVIPCECLTFTNTDESAIDHDISYTDCFGDFIETTISAGQVINVCGCCGLASSELVIISVGANCIEGACPTTTTTTTICNNPSVITNGTFTSNLDGWDTGLIGGWFWSPAHGGSAHYTGNDQYDILSQNVLILGQTYDITFDVWCDNPNVLIKALAGHSEYNTFVTSGYMQVHAILTCTSNTIFGIQAYDAIGAPYNTVYVKNINVSVHCSQFTTTTTTCNPSTHHPYSNFVINSTNTIPDANTLLVNACSAAACRSIGSCTLTSSTTLYYDVQYPPIGSLTYSSSNGCTLSGLTGYYPITLTGNSSDYIVAYIFNSVIVNYPSCT